MDPAFFTVENMVECIGIFSDHMLARYRLDVAQVVDELELRRVFLAEMEHVRDEQRDAPAPLKALNNAVMNRVKLWLLKRQQQADVPVVGPPPAQPGGRGAAQPGGGQVLDRERQVFGTRHVVLAEQLHKPAFSGARVDAQAQAVSLDALVVQRNAELGITAPPAKLPDTYNPVSDVALDEEEFARRLRAYEEERSNVAVAPAAPAAPVEQAAPPAAPPAAPLPQGGQDRLVADAEARLRPEDADPSAVYRAAAAAAAGRKAGAAGAAAAPRRASVALSALPAASGEEGGAAPAAPSAPAPFIMAPVLAAPPSGAPAPSASRARAVSVRYLSICGADRDWAAQRRRYSYTVRLGGGGENDPQAAPRDVVAVAVRSVVLPLDVLESRSIVHAPRRTFQHDFSLGYPYLVLRISELGSNYDGTNPVVRDCFCKLMFDTSYSTPSGRGFLVLKPMQDEERVFSPAPLASLPRLTVQLLKPNGTLFNNSTDDYEVAKLEHEPFNPHLVKLVLDKFFDRNEFTHGDHIIVRGFRLRPDAPAGEQLPPALRRVEEFANRPEGHEVVEVGEANEAGFHRTLYVLAPGVLDADAGRVAQDAEAVAALNEHNASAPPAIQLESGAPGNGRVMNTTLQNVFGLCIKVLEPRAETAGMVRVADEVVAGPAWGASTA